MQSSWLFLFISFAGNKDLGKKISCHQIGLATFVHQPNLNLIFLNVLKSYSVTNEDFIK